MLRRTSVSSIFRILAATLMLPCLVLVGHTQDERVPDGMRVATGQRITPSAAAGAQVLRLHTDLGSDENADAANAVTTALSPDGTTLLVLTSGTNNSFFKDDGTPITYDVLDPTTGQSTGGTKSSVEWVFVYDVRGPVPVPFINNSFKSNRRVTRCCYLFCCAREKNPQNSPTSRRVAG